MALHLPHAEGGFGVTLNDITKDAAFYTTTSRFVPWLGAFSQERQGLWVVVAHGCSSGPVPESWSSSPLLLLRDIHSKLLPEYNCKEGCAPSESQVHVDANDGLSSQDGALQQQVDVTLLIPQLNRHTEASLVRGEDFSNVTVTVIACAAARRHYC